MLLMPVPARRQDRGRRNGCECGTPVIHVLVLLSC